MERKKIMRGGVLAVVLAAFLAFATLAVTGRAATANAEETPKIYWGIKTYQTDFQYELILGNSESDINGEDTVASGSMDYYHNCSGSEYNVPWIGKQEGSSHVAGPYYSKIYSVRVKSMIAPRDMSHWFYSFCGESIDLTNIDMRGTTSMSKTFASSDLKTIDFTGWQVPTGFCSIGEIFLNCRSLVSADLSALTVYNSNGTTLPAGVFSSCDMLEKVVAPHFTDTEAPTDGERPYLELPKEFYQNYESMEAPFWNGTELTYKITNADGGKTFTRHSACSSFTHIAACAATCTQEGISREHWVCKLCGKKYADDEGKTEITESVTVAARGHDYGEWIDEVAATATQDGAKGHYACSVCHKNFDVSHNEIESIVIPASGSSTPDNSDTGNESTGGNGTSGNGTSGNGTGGKKGLGGGAIAGIVIACIVALAAGGFCLWFFLLRKGKQKHRQ